MFGIGPLELVVILVVALLIFGPQRLPELARTLGKGLAEVRRASNDLRHTLALDELQNDLRKTMNQATSLPSDQSRPAQAGDDLPPGTNSAAAAAGAPASAAGASADAPGAAADAEPGASTADPAAPGTPPWKHHPGQLPDGGDQDHNDVSPPADPGPAAPGRLAAADPGLGNVPVTGDDPAEKRRG